MSTLAILVILCAWTLYLTADLDSVHDIDDGDDRYHSDDS